MVQPQAGKHVTMVTLAGKGGDSQQIQVHIGTGERFQLKVSHSHPDSGGL